MDLIFWFRFCANFLFDVKNDQNDDESGNLWYSTWPPELEKLIFGLFIGKGGILRDFLKKKQIKIRKTEEPWC
jgi:hypothetical protein